MSEEKTKAPETAKATRRPRNPKVSSAESQPLPLEVAAGPEDGGGEADGSMIEGSQEVRAAEEVKPARRTIVRKPKAAPSPEPTARTSEPPGGLAGLWVSLTTKTGGKALGAGDTGLSAAFLLSLLVGTALCVVGQVGFVGAREIGFAGPLLATLAYPLWGYWSGAVKSPSLRERLADNAYYLGFIFTQIALLVGFLPAAFGSAKLEADQIIRLFGVALGASLVGLVARTILVQLSYSVDEAADVVSGEVSSLARQVTEQSRIVLDYFDTLVSRLAITHAKLTADLNTGMTSLTGTVTEYNATMVQDAEALHAAITAASSAADGTGAEVGRQQARLADAVEAMTTGITGLREMLETHTSRTTESIQATTAALESQVRQATEALRSVTGAVEQSLASVRSVADVQDTLGQLAPRIAGIEQNLASVNLRVSSLDADTAQSIGGIKAGVEAAGRQAVERAAAVSSETAEAVAALERTLLAFRQELERLRAER